MDDEDDDLPLPTPISVPETVAAVKASQPTAPLPADAVDLASVVQRAVGPFRRRCGDDGVTLKESFAAGLQVKAKPAQLQTAIEEIIKNALDAMISAENKKLTVETSQEGAYACICITDTGQGIPKSDFEKIFEPFFTTKSESSRGLGLTVVKRLLEFVSGESRLESESGKGTSFTLLIPMPNVHVVASTPAVVKPITQKPAAPRPVEPRIPEFLDDGESADEMSFAPMHEVAKKVEIRKPVGWVFD